MTKKVTRDEYIAHLKQAGLTYIRCYDRVFYEFETDGSMPCRLTIYFDDRFEYAEMTVDTKDMERGVTTFRSMAALDRALGVLS